ncbi:MAG: pantetheine-phosphate adenylyltransferase [Bacteroidales bacterium]|nr:pantetheine-phosphate adenylyltransferase [Bacteroidales bacterium]
MSKIAVFPGSFDPFTIGHESIVRRAVNIFDKLIIAIGFNTNKTGFWPLEKRTKMITDIFIDDPRIVIDAYSDLTVDYCNRVGAHFMIRGLRTAVDFEYERSIGQSNKQLDPGIESVFILTAPEYTHVNSSIVRDIIGHNGDASMFMSKKVNYRDYL